MEKGIGDNFNDFLKEQGLHEEVKELAAKKATLHTSAWNLAEEINDKDDVVGILDAALEEHDASFFFRVLDDISRSKGMLRVSEKLGMDINKEKPSVAVIIDVLDSLGLQLTEVYTRNILIISISI
jgi:DNA-binding phage protein